MRLKQYIIAEATPSPAARIITKLNNRLLAKIGKDFAKQGWNLTDDQAIKIINKYIRKLGDIKLELALTHHAGGKAKLNRWILGAQIWTAGEIDIFVLPGFADQFKRFARPDKQKNFFEVVTNQFFRQLIEVMSHELIHLGQYDKIPEKDRGKDTYGSNGKTEKEYLSDHMEIEAFAHDTALEFIKWKKSKTYARYLNTFGKRHKTFKKFVKRMMYYVKDLMGEQ